MIRIRDEDLASLGSIFSQFWALVKRMQKDKFQRFILSSHQNAMSNVLQACVCCFSLQQGVSGFNSDTIVINNAKRKWQIIDTKDNSNIRLS